MRADRLLLASAVFLGAGLSIIFRYGTSGANVSTAVPWTNVGFHLNLAASGPAAIGGAALTAIGALLLIWAVLSSLAWHASLLFDRDRDDDGDFLRILPSSDTEVIEDSSPVSSGPIAGHRRFL